MFDDDMIYDDEKSKQIARCEECKEEIYDDSQEVYIDEDGNYFCSLECACRYHGIRKSED